MLDQYVGKLPSSSGQGGAGGMSGVSNPSTPPESKGSTGSTASAVGFASARHFGARTAGAADVEVEADELPAARVRVRVEVPAVPLAEPEPVPVFVVLFAPVLAAVLVPVRVPATDRLRVPEELRHEEALPEPADADPADEAAPTGSFTTTGAVFARSISSQMKASYSATNWSSPYSPRSIWESLVSKAAVIAALLTLGDATMRTFRPSSVQCRNFFSVSR